jgi:hypothetical protein
MAEIAVVNIAVSFSTFADHSNLLLYIHSAHATSVLIVLKSSYCANPSLHAGANHWLFVIAQSVCTLVYSLLQQLKRYTRSSSRIEYVNALTQTAHATLSLYSCSVHVTQCNVLHALSDAVCATLVAATKRGISAHDTTGIPYYCYVIHGINIIATPTATSITSSTQCACSTTAAVVALKANSVVLQQTVDDDIATAYT